MHKRIFLIFLFSCGAFHDIHAQKVTNVDKAFLHARQLAFANKYDSAKVLCLKILAISPNYSDVRVLLGRVYYWSDQPDLARQQLKTVLDKKPYEDAYVAFADIEQWSGNYDESYRQAVVGLDHFPASEELKKRKSRALASLTGTKTVSVDSEYLQARSLAFSGQYDSSMSMCKRILNRSPDYSDVRVLLGKVYFWKNQPDSAKEVLKTMLEKDPNEDGYIALSDIERWTDNYVDAHNYAVIGLMHYPKSEALMLRKVRALESLKKYQDAYDVVDTLMARNKNNDEARQLAESLKRSLSVNILTISYSFDHFDSIYSPYNWHLFSVAYSRSTKTFGSLVWRINRGFRFGNSGTQLEMDAYPTISKKMYMYLNFGYSPSQAVFPEYRAGFSLYRSFPYKFEGEVGMRLLYFNPKPIVLYVGSIGKYWKDFWFSFRTYVIPDENDNGFSMSGTFIARYYTKGVNDYFTYTIGYGSAPDDRSALTIQNPLLQSFTTSFGAQMSYKYYNIFFATIGYSNQDFYFGPGGSLPLNTSDYFFTIGYQRYF